MTKQQQRFFGLFRSALVGLAATALAFAPASAQTVTTPSGTFPAATFQGTAGSGITTFEGIRYAAAPTGQLRFAPPTAPAAVSGTVF